MTTTYNPDTGLLYKKNRKIGWLCISNGHMMARYGGRQYPYTHVIWKIVHDVFPSGVIDHINGNPLDNRLDNLRDVTQAENLSNKHKAQSNNTLGILGVDFINGKYRARLRIPGKSTTHLGMFKSAKEAHEAYLTERAKHHPIKGIENYDNRL